jgi:hypothetical protein
MSSILQEIEKAKCSAMQLYSCDGEIARIAHRIVADLDEAIKALNSPFKSRPTGWGQE